MVVELLVALIVSADASAASPANPAPLPQAIATRQTVFAIPFHIQRVPQPSLEPAQVQLYVSTDRGASWRLCGRADPRQGRFAFRAGGDGEYWFLMRTVDRSGQFRPQGEAQPGLRVIVDTTPPKLRLEARAMEGGRVTTRWQIDDAYPNLESLKIQYRVSPTQPWHSVAIDRMGQSGATTHTGEVSWLAPAGSARLEIRADVSDTAGNPAVSNAQVVLAGDGKAAASMAAMPVANPRSDPNASLGRGAQSMSQDWQEGWQAMASAGGTARGSPSNEFSASSSPSPTGQTPGSGLMNTQGNPAVGGQYGASGHAAANRIPPPIPAGVRPRMVKSRSFELAYNVDKAGPSGITKVELWGTRDGGQTWSSFGQDEDRRSPIVATIDEDGLYGFCVCVQNGEGLGGEPPQSGQTPDIWIGVDRTKPDLRILSADQGDGDQSSRLLIRWEARDWALAAKSVSLSYGGTRGGPWTLIASGLEGTGQYNWFVDSGAPEYIFLRIEARDEAGNLGVYQTPQPVVFDRLRPSAHIQQVRPVGQ